MNKTVKITNNIEEIIEYQKNKIPCVLLLDDSNKDKDTSGIKYCALLEKEDMQDEEYIRNLLGDEYLDMVEARCYGKPLVIANTNRLVIRELTMGDIDGICNIYEGKDTDFLGCFYESREDAAAIINRYINEVYDFYGFGLWAVVLKDTDELVGVVGFTPRDSGKDKIDIELGYAINTSYRKRGLGYEAAKAVIEYADNNIEHNNILINVNSDNIPGKILGNKLKVLTTDVIFCSIDEAKVL